MSKPEFVYTTYIETSAEKLWQALTDGDFTVRYWFGHRAASDWKVGSAYTFTREDAHTIEGEVLVSDPPKRLEFERVRDHRAQQRDRETACDSSATTVTVMMDAGRDTTARSG